MEAASIELTGQVAIVTGGGRGIGRAIAQALARAGAAVAVVARTQEQLDETVGLIVSEGGRAIAIPADVTDQEAVEQMVATVRQELGPVDLLVNNAGIGGPIGPACEAEADAWWRVLDVNLRGPYLCARAVVPGMITRRSGRIINTASGAGLSSRPYFSAYCVSKAAVIRLTEILAAETGQHGICVFSIHPGFVHTALVEEAASCSGDEMWLGGLFRKGIQEGRTVSPASAASLVLELASGKADALSGRFVRAGDDVAGMVSRAEEIREKDLYRLRLRT